MKYTIFLFLIIPVLLYSCGGAKKSLKNQASRTEAVEATPPVVKEQAKDTVSPAITPIIEKEEKVIPVKPDVPAPSQYFVIIGSFRNPENASRYQKQILQEGFQSVLLQNEQGLIRVSVLATNDILQAREEIQRIRTRFHRHSDTWLLIQKK